MCVFHPKDYRRCAWDLMEYSNPEGYFPGGNPPFARIYTDPHGGAGFMNGPHVGYTNNRAYYIERNIPGANEVDQMAVQHQGQHLDPDAGFMNGRHDDYNINLASSSGLNLGTHQSEFEQQQTSYTQSLTVSSGIPLVPISQNEVYHPELPENNSLMETYYSQPLNSSLEVPPQVPQQIVTQDEDLPPLVLSENISVFQSSGYHPSTEIQRNISSNTYSINDSMHYMPWGTNMTNDNEPLLEPFSLSDWEDYLR